eukprot:732172-Lingulodinium_polyedra.AAC.1
MEFQQVFNKLKFDKFSTKTEKTCPGLNQRIGAASSPRCRGAATLSTRRACPCHPSWPARH